MGEAIEVHAVEPAVWVLVFRRTSKVWWCRLLGHYKHVAAYAYLPGMRAWLFYEVHLGPTTLIVVPDGAHLAIMAEFIADADLIAMRRSATTPARFRRRLVLNCVTAVRDLIGLDSGALLPDRLWRDCLRAGGNPLGQTAAILPAPAGA